MDMPTHDHAGPCIPMRITTREAPESDSLKDPVCGMTVTDRSAHHVEHAGRPYYFCSAKCLTKFIAEPAKYAGDAVAPAAALAAASAAGGRRHDLHLPDAPGDPPGPSRQLPEVRHDAGAGAAQRWTTTRTRSWPTSRAASGGRCR